MDKNVHRLILPRQKSFWQKPDRSEDRMKRCLLVFGFVVCFALNLHAGPPEGKWKLTFDEECDGSSIDVTKWVVFKTPPNTPARNSAGIVSSREPEDLVVSDGICHFVTRKEEVIKGMPWTSAAMNTRTFHQQFGYFEARIRFNGASGLNNAFWLNSADARVLHFEIDIVEGHFPNELNLTLHHWTGGHTQRQTKLYAHEDLSRGFHLYGLLWTPQQMTWFFDGRPMHTEPSPEVRGEMNILLSTAVLPWAGAISNKLNGTSMDVDWVHAYESAEPGEN